MTHKSCEFEIGREYINLTESIDLQARRCDWLDSELRKVKKDLEAMNRFRRLEPGLLFTNL